VPQVRTGAGAYYGADDAIEKDVGTSTNRSCSPHRFAIKEVRFVSLPMAESSTTRIYSVVSDDTARDMLDLDQQFDKVSGISRMAHWSLS
jgi:hypothetical protein